MTLHCEVRGPADATSVVVFLHGLGSSSADWPYQVPAFAERHRVVLVDLPGHGRSPLPAGGLTVDAMAVALETLLDRLGAARAHAVGLSLGGCVGLALALAAPARVRSLTVVNAFPRLRPAGVRGAGRMLVRAGLLAAAPMTVVAAHIARGLFPRPEQRELYLLAVASLSRISRRSYVAGARALTRFDVRARLASVACPTLVVAGSIDRTVRLADQEALARAIPGARLAVVPGSGHATPHDQPEMFNRLALDFIAANP